MTGKRKSGRKAGSSSKKETPEKTRRSSRRRGQKKSESEDDSGSEKSVDEREEARETPKMETDLSKEEESAGSDGAWQVRSENGNKGGIPKLKISLHRPAESSPTPEPLSSPRPRRSRRGAANEEASEDDAAGPSKDSSVCESSENESERRPSRSRKRKGAGHSQDASAQGEDENVSEHADDSAQRAEEEAERERQEEAARLEAEKKAEEASERKRQEENARLEAKRKAEDEKIAEQERQRLRKDEEEREAKIRAAEEEKERKAEVEREQRKTAELKEKQEAKRLKLEQEVAMLKSIEEKEARRKSLEEREAKKKRLEEEALEASRKSEEEHNTREEKMETSVEEDAGGEQEKDTDADNVEKEVAATDEKADSDVEVMASRVTSEGQDGRRRSRRSPSRDSSEERAKQAALNSRRPKETTGSEDGEVPDSPEGEISFPVRTEGKLRTSSNATTKENQEQPVVRKRRWGSSNSSQPAKKPLSISTDILKEIIPEVKPVALSEVQLSLQTEEIALDDGKAPQERRSSKSEDNTRSRRRRDMSSDESEKDYEEEAVDSDGEEMVKKRPPAANHTEVKDKVEEVKETITKAETETANVALPVRKPMAPEPEAITKQRSPSPARHPVSNVLFITNLVRPFTVVQLRDLLARTGTIADEKGFWIDPIKSKCYVKYTNEEDAKNTRHALHGVRWPASNPKQLNVDFSTEAAMTIALEGGRPVAVDDRQAAIAERRQREREREVREKERRVRDEKEPAAGRLADLENGRQVRHVSDRERERERDRGQGHEKDADKDRRDDKPTRTVRKVSLPVREWDLGKAERGFSPPAEDMRHPAERKRDHGRQRSLSPEPLKKSRKREDVTPQKRLLDDLFRKTKTTPCIYWLPLTDQQIAEKEAQRRKHMEENEKRIAEVKKRREAKEGKRRRSRSRSPKK